jgi:NADPH:quinone reductase-like Zn-dependent oxidoreductase
MGRTAGAHGDGGVVPRRAQAAVVDALGPPAQSLRVREVDVGEPGTGQVLVRVEFAGVNFPDVLMVRRGRAQGKAGRLAWPPSPRSLARH